jgi:AcrR family transcriptional regulator
MKNKQYTQEQIYEVALSVFAKFGFKKTTMDDVAKELSMTQGNIYLYVKNKRDLFEKSLLHAICKFEKHMIEALQREKDVVKQIISMSAAGFEYISKNQDLGSILNKEEDLLIHPQESFFSSENIEKYLEVNAFSKNMLISSLKQGIKEKRFRDFDVDIISELLSQIYMMFIKQMFVMPEEMSRREMTKEIVNLVLYGIVSDRKKNKMNIAYTGYSDE